MTTLAVTLALGTAIAAAALMLAAALVLAGVMCLRFLHRLGRNLDAAGVR